MKSILPRQCFKLIHQQKKKKTKNLQLQIKINFHEAISQYLVAKHFHVHPIPPAGLW